MFHRKCKKKILKKKRECKITKIDLIKEWKFFEHGKFIVIPEEYVF